MPYSIIQPEQNNLLPINNGGISPDNITFSAFTPRAEIVPNPIKIDDSSYNGFYFAYEASGGFTMERGVGKAVIAPYGNIKLYEVTNSLQVKYDVREFNKKLGLYKDDSNIAITSTSYNPTTNSFAVDEITITAAEFSSQVTTHDIISVGRYSTAYSEFNLLLNNFFQFPDGFSTFFTGGTVFDASAMVNIMHGSSQNPNGEYINDMSGTITISHINALMRYTFQYNPFNNREINLSIEKGFIENDLIYIPTGTTVTLVANIINDTNNPSNMNSQYIQTPYHNELPNTAALNDIRNRSPPLDTAPNSSSNYTQKTTFYTDSIVRVLKVPVLIILKNLSSA
jgi:hypothetical protein